MTTDKDAPKFSPGDIVTTVIDGPTMMVASVSEDMANCQWFVGGDLRMDAFYHECLRKCGDRNTVTLKQGEPACSPEPDDSSEPFSAGQTQSSQLTASIRAFSDAPTTSRSALAPCAATRGDTTSRAARLVLATNTETHGLQLCDTSYRPNSPMTPNDGKLQWWALQQTGRCR